MMISTIFSSENSSGENVLCPRCMRMNPSMHGICTGCGENIMQCPHFLAFLQSGKLIMHHHKKI